MPDTLTEYANPDALVTTEWLAENLHDPSLRIVEVDEDTEAYTRSHIPDAIAWNSAKDLHHPVQRDYLNQAGFSGLLAEAGVTDDTTAILYGDNNNWFAAYAYWLLRLRGYDSVKLLNGGRQKWNVEKRSTKAEVPQFEKTDFAISGRERPELRALRDHVLERVASSEALIRQSVPEEYSGVKLPRPLTQEQPYMGGHVPGALNIPWSQAAHEDGSFRSTADLAELYGSAGVTADKEVIAYCRIGERSSHTWFVLHELLGFERGTNYDGSWTEYGSLVAAPVEK